MIFSDLSMVKSGLSKPIPGIYLLILGHFISVNNEAKLVMIASANWQFKIYSQKLGYTGIKLNVVLSFQQPYENPSICLQLINGLNCSTLFYSLRLGLDS